MLSLDYKQTNFDASDKLHFLPIFCVLLDFFSGLGVRRVLRKRSERLAVQPFADCAAGVNQGKLFCPAARLFDHGRLKRVKGHAQCGGGGRSPETPPVGLAADILFENRAGGKSQGGVPVLGRWDNADFFARQISAIGKSSPVSP